MYKNTLSLEMISGFVRLVSENNCEICEIQINIKLI
jgi:hypothetical protein